MLRVEMLGKFRQHVQQLDAGSDLKPRRSWCCGDPSSRNGKVGGVSDNFDPTRSVRMFVGGRGHYALTALWSSTQNVAGSCISWVERAFCCASRGAEVSRRHHSFEDRATIGVLPTLANAESLGVSRCL